MFGRILVIDKDMEWRDFFYDIFTQANYNVTTFPSAREIIILLRNERPDYIIYGIQIDEDKGVFAKIREIDKNIKIIVISQDALTGKDAERQFGSDKRIYFLEKSVNRTQLIQTLFDMLKQESIDAIDKKAAFSDAILVVDDEEEANNLIRDYLERRSYNVASAFNGEEALLKIKMHKPKVVILDVYMRGIDGMLILKHIKEINKNTVVIMTSGIADDAIIKESIALGASGYLVKPFNLSKLEAAILAHSLVGDRHK